MHVRSNVFWLSGWMTVLAACTSTGPKSVVVERIGGLDETPEWATGQIAMAEEGKEVQFINVMTMAGDARPEACVRGAEETGRANMIRYIKEHLTTSGQVSEMHASQDPAVESLTAFLSQHSISGVRIHSRYWEKVKETDPEGNISMKIRCAARVTIGKNVLERQLRDAIYGSSGNPDIRKKLLDAQQKFIENLGHETAE